MRTSYATKFIAVCVLGIAGCSEADGMSDIYYADAGPRGATGPQGATGPRGEQGDPGAKGATGEQGAQGAQGATGPQGDVGDAGARGATGPQGANGAPGDAGARGPTGPRGLSGDAGPQGLQGLQGPQGDAGASPAFDVQPAGPSVQCPTGGQEVRMGADLDGSGSLDVDEIQDSVTLCNGADGQGVTATTSTTPEAPGINCANGGTRIELAVYRSTTGDAGAPLSTSIFYSCDGAQGPQGIQGPQGDAGPQGPEGPQGPQGLGGEVATPAISPAADLYEDSVSVTLTAGTLGATIYYTTDGSPPDTNSTQYTGPFVLTASATVNAIAVKSGRVDSLVASADYEIVSVLRVTPTGDDQTADGSAQNPYGSLEAAATAASSLSGEVEVRVAAGSYVLASTIFVPSGLTILGGYDGTNWSLRDAQANVVNLDSANAQQTFDMGPNTFVDGFVIEGSGATSGLNSCFFSLSGGVTISNNTCNFTATGNASDYGVFVLGFGPNLVEGNTITIAGGNNSWAAGITAQTTDLVVRNNKVTISYDGRYAFALDVYPYAGPQTLQVYNNVFDSGSPTALVNGGNAVDVDLLQPGSEITFLNNTIRTGTEMNNGFTYSGIRVDTQDPTTQVTIANNIVFCRNAAAGNNRAITFITPDSASIFENNNLFDCSAGLFNDGSTTDTTELELNAHTYAAGNLAFDMVDGTDTYFVAEGSNWHLKTGGSGSFLTVKTGAAPYNLFAADYDSIARTGSAGTGWSMGAYEQDF